MKKHESRIAALAAVGTILAAAGAVQAAGPVRVTISRDELATRPINPLVYGNFVELGFGRQPEGMWAEMFFNRSFEKVPPYSPTQWFWLSRSEKDNLTTEEWWHSGYEEKPWYLVPGSDKAELRLFEFAGICHGQQGAWLLNDQGTKPAAFAQDGIYLRKDETYQFRGAFRAVRQMFDVTPTSVTVNAEIRLYPEGKLDKPLLTVPVKDIRASLDYREADLAVPGFEGRATFSVWIPARSALNVDAFSLVPKNNVDGWRADVVEAARRVKPAILRWPGGCFASFYDWREGIGRRDDRSPKPSAFWGGLNDNDIGTPEFLRFCRLVGAEPFLCVNMITGSPEQAAEWVAYCNLPAGHPLAARRRQDGSAAPHAVKFWELDNETYRRWAHAGYARRCVDFSKAMKAVDPSIQLVMVGYADFQPHLAEMLEICGRHIDLVSDRATDEAGLRRDLAIIADYNRRNGTKIRLCNTEWLPQVADVAAQPDNYNRQPLPKDVTLQNRQIRWRYAMNTARQLMTFQRLGGEFVFANFNNFANTWGQNVIECAKESAWLSGPGLVFEMFSRSPAAWVLRSSPNPSPDVDVQAAWDARRTAVVVNALNYTAAPVTVEVDLKALGRTFRRAEVTALTGTGLGAHLTPKTPDAIKRTDRNMAIAGKGDMVTLELPPFSLTQAVVKR